jgi:hypothetical protein
MTVVDKELVARKGTATNGRAAAAATTSKVTIMTAEELGATVEGPVAAASAEVRAEVDRWVENYKAELVSSAELALAAQDKAAREAREGNVALGGPGIGSYMSFDVVSISPLQFIGNPPYLPHKIVAGGELMLLQALQWINPRVDIPQGFAIPATVQLGGRHLRVRFDQLNLTTGVAGPNFNINIPILPNPAPTFILFSLLLVAPPVAQTQLFEVNVTSDIVGMSQPYAAFATWHRDRDAELPWLAPAPANFPDSVPANRWLHNAPMRYMVYPQ